MCVASGLIVCIINFFMTYSSYPIAFQFIIKSSSKKIHSEDLLIQGIIEIS